MATTAGHAAEAPQQDSASLLDGVSLCLKMHRLHWRQGAQQGWACTWMTSTTKKLMVKLQISTCTTATDSTADFGLAGCWLLYTGCRAVQHMRRGLWMLNRSSLKSGCILMKYIHCFGPGGPMTNLICTHSFVIVSALSLGVQPMHVLPASDYQSCRSGPTLSG